MPSKDLLEKLFDVEHQAEEIIAEAREEAGRLVDSAKTRAQKYYTEAYDAAMAKALASRELAEKAARDEYDAALLGYRTKLEASILDHESFAAACLAALGEDS
jgi:vacuolar-type H+-ATPase subunit H